MSPLEMTPVEFYENVWRQKTKSPWATVELRLLTDKDCE